MNKAPLVLAGAALVAGCTSLSTQVPAASPSAPAASSPSVAATASIPGFTSATATGPASCDPVLWTHVYHPRRLHLLADGCITVTGTVDAVRAEPDGDFHILLRLGAGEQGYANAVNISAQHGDLVLEPVCSVQVTQADAVRACQGYHSTVPVVHRGDSVVVTGSFVLDAEHGWNEIHPVHSIEILGRA